MIHDGLGLKEPGGAFLKGKSDMVKWRQMEWDEWKARPFDGRQTTDRPTTMTRARLWKSTEETDPGSAITPARCPSAVSHLHVTGHHLQL